MGRAVVGAVVVGAVVVVVVVGLVAWLGSWRVAVDGRPVRPRLATQVSFEPVVKVPRCADYLGTGPVPAEGHAVLFVHAAAGGTMYFAAEVDFDAARWVAEDVVLGEVDDRRHFTLYLYAVTAEFRDWVELLPPGYPIHVLPRRLLDVMTVIRDGRPDTC